MESSQRMERVITAILAAQGRDPLTMQPGDGIKLRLGGPLSGFPPLVIEKISPWRLLVAHYRDSLAGDQELPDPEIVFSLHVISGWGWVPVECRNALGRSYCYATYNEDDTIYGVNHAGIADLNELAELWGADLQEQGWIQRSDLIAVYMTLGSLAG